ncbi:MAG: glycosyltransferase, partial [Synechococcus sp.]
MAGLSVVIPTLEEASRLPLLLADLQRWPGELEVIVSDAGSRDHTRAVAQLAGAT